MRALVVDDSRAIRSILGLTLKGLGFEVADAGNGREALERLKSLPRPDVMLVDWNMPEMNGYDFLCAVRADATYNDSRVMMVTTETEMEQMIKALSAGANEYVMKPFTKEVIREKLELMGLLTA
ncbi:MAG TPA: response regulator [Gemmataceae bacterium]|nr:response regulator [Gemmataceae bacterium]